MFSSFNLSDALFSFPPCRLFVILQQLVNLSNSLRSSWFRNVHFTTHKSVSVCQRLPPQMRCN